MHSHRAYAKTLLLSLAAIMLPSPVFTSSLATINTYNVTVTASGQSAPTHTQTFTLTLTQ